VAQRLPDRRPRALIADGDLPTRLLLSRHLVSEGFDIIECGDGRDALDQLVTSHFDLIVLDGALPNLDGIALCRAIRQGSTNPCSAVFIVAASAAKPFSMREFLARVSAVMRRAARAGDGRPRDRIERPDIRLDPSKRQVHVRGRAVACSKQEFDLLYALACSPGTVFSREELLARHWPSFAASPLRRDKPTAAIRLVDPIISRLRRKIEIDPDSPRVILTVWGVGYKVAEESEH